MNKKSAPHLFSFSFFPFLVGGFTDSLSPCGLTTVLFFAISLFFYWNKRKVTVVFPAIFIGGVLFTKFLIVIGLLDKVLVSGTCFSLSRFFYLSVAGFSFVLALINFRAWYLSKKSRPEMSTEDWLGRALIKVVGFREWLFRKNRFVSSPLSCSFLFFCLGCVTALLMAVCAESAYVSVLVLNLAGQQQYGAVFLYAFLYCLCFVFPLVFVLISVAMIFSSEKMKSLVLGQFSLVRIVRAAIFFSISIGIFYIFL